MAAASSRSCCLWSIEGHHDLQIVVYLCNPSFPIKSWGQSFLPPEKFSNLEANYPHLQAQNFKKLTGAMGYLIILSEVKEVPGYQVCPINLESMNFCRMVQSCASMEALREA